MLRLRFFAPLLLLPLFSYAGCGAGDVNPPPQVAAEGGTLDGNVGETGGDSPASGTTQTGKIVNLSGGAPIEGAKVTAGANSTTTDANGKYTLAVDPKTPFNMRVEKTGGTPTTNFYTLTEQETLVKASIDLGKTSFLSEQTATLLLATLSGYDASLGVVSVAIELKGCADEGGATFDFLVNGQEGGTGKIMYASGGVPSPAQTSAESGSFPHAVIYNLPPNQPVEITVKHPKCTMVPFPVDKAVDTGTITYTSSKIQALPGKATSFVRVFLK